MTLRSELVGAVEYQRNPDKLLRSGQLVSIVLPCDFAKALAVTEKTDLAVASQWIESVLPRKRGICRLGWFTSTTSKPWLRRSTVTATPYEPVSSTPIRVTKAIDENQCSRAL